MTLVWPAEALVTPDDLPIGVEINSYTGGPYVWKTIWQYTPENVDPVMGAANFYLLQAVSNNALSNMIADNHMLSLQQDAKRRLNQTVTQLDEVFLKYGLMAVGGEARYIRRLGDKKLSRKRAYAWIGFKTAYDQLGPAVLEEIATEFDQQPDTSAGGPTWATVTRLVHQRVTRKISPVVFVDSVIGLQHNTGVFLNKVPWNSQSGGDWAGGLSIIQDHIGPATSALETQWRVLKRYADLPVRNLWSDYSNAVKRESLFQ